MLDAPWWQGIAGIAQILAAIFAIVSIIQARKTIRQAEEDRHNAVAPDWSVASIEDHRGLGRATEVEQYAEFRNSGWGPARRVHAEFRPENGNREKSLRCEFFFPGGSVVPADTVDIAPGSQFRLSFGWALDGPLQGQLIIHCITRFGRQVSQGFALQTYVEGSYAKCRLEAPPDNLQKLGR